MKRSNTKKSGKYVGRRVLLWALSFLFLSTIAHATTKFDYLTYDYTDCGIVTCTSYYTLHNPTTAIQTIDKNTLSISSIKQEKGYLSNIRIEYFNGTSWNEQQEALIKDSNINEGKTKIATLEEITANPNAIKNIQKADITIPQGSVIDAVKESINPKIEETIIPTMALINTLQENPGKDIKIRITGDIVPIYQNGMISYAFDHIPSFQGYTYPEYAVWNQTFQKCINVNITYTLLQATSINETFPQRILLNSSIINTSAVNADWSDLRISNGTCLNVNSDYSHNFVYKNTTNAEIIFYAAANDIRNATPLTIAIYYNNTAATHVEAASSAISFGQGNMQRVRIFTNDIANDTDNLSQIAFNESSGAFGTLISMNIAQIVNNAGFYWGKEKQLNSTNGGIYTYVGTTRPDQNINGFSTMFKFRLYNGSTTLNKQYLFHIGNASAPPQSNGARLGVAEMWLQGTPDTTAFNRIIVQNMTAYNAPTPYAIWTNGTSFNSNCDPWRSFDNSIYGGAACSAVGQGDVLFNERPGIFLGLDLGAGNATIINSFNLTFANYNSSRQYDPTTFNMSGSNDNSSYTALGVATYGGINTTNAAGRTIQLNFTNTVAYRYYKFQFMGTAGNGALIQYSEIMPVINLTTKNFQTLNVSVYYYNATYSKTFNLGTLQSNTTYGIGLTATLTDANNQRTQVFFNGTKLDENYSTVVGNPAGGYPFSQDTSSYCASGSGGGSTCFKNYLWGAHGIINQTGDIQSVNETLNGTIDEIIIADSAVGNTTKFSLPMMEAWTYSAPQITFGGALGVPDPITTLACGATNKTQLNCNWTNPTNVNSQINITDNHNQAFSGTDSVTTFNGIKFFTKYALTLTGVQKGSLTTSTRAYLLDENKTVLSNVSFSGQSATFNMNLNARTSYYIATDSSGAAHTRQRTANLGGLLPVVGQNINFTAGLNNGADDTTILFDISNITTAYNGFFINVSINGSAMVTLTNDSRSYNFTNLIPATWYLSSFIVFDSLGLTSITISNLSKTASNFAPNITDYTPTNLSFTINENTTQNFTANATDDDGNPVYQWFKDNVFQVFGQIYTWIIGYNEQGAHNITVIVNDSYGASASVTWNVTVNDTFPAPLNPVFNPAGGSYRTYIPISCRSPNSYSAVDDYTISVSVNGASPINLSEHNKYAAIDFDITKYNYYTNFTFNCTANSFAGNISSTSGIFTRDYVNEFYSTTTQNNFDFNSLQPYTFSLYYDASTIANNIFVQYAYADCNGDGLYDYVYNYTSINPSRIKNYYTCVFPTGQINYEIGVYLNKTAGTSWSGSGCSADYDYSNNCLVKKTYTLKVN